MSLKTQTIMSLKCQAILPPFFLAFKKSTMAQYERWKLIPYLDFCVEIIPIVLEKSQITKFIICN